MTADLILSYHGYKRRKYRGVYGCGGGFGVAASGINDGNITAACGRITANFILPFAAVKTRFLTSFQDNTAD
ncbi:MAG: hypothetical protein LBP79_05345 [Clostridiales bacterium]|jgi:hypothetical protein|nr:hypothetical protein [Clostridiales bacterium]